jgi:hypothetical protein
MDQPQLQPRDIFPAIETWLSQVRGNVPLIAASESDYRDSLVRLIKATPEMVGTEIEALLWLRIGLIDRAHEIVQEAGAGLPAYVHGIIHRMEQDYWNSNYWFRRVGTRLPSDFGTQVAKASGDSRFDTFEFTNYVEAWSRTKGVAEGKSLEKTAQAEWQVVWNWARSERH